VRPHTGSPEVDRLERSPALSGDLPDAPRTASPIPPRRPSIDAGAVRPQSAGHIVPVLRRRAWRSSGPGSVEVQAACWPQWRLEPGDRGDAAPLVAFGGTGAAEGVLALVGPTTPKQTGPSRIRTIRPKRKRLLGGGLAERWLFVGAPSSPRGARDTHHRPARDIDGHRQAI
jgi:hypothetical protein